MKLRRTLLALILIPSLAQGASPKRHRIYNWTGLYAGGNLGYGLAYGGVAFIPLPDAATFNNLAPVTLTLNPGFSGGGQIGFNAQSGNWISGLEGDFQKGPAVGVTRTPIIQNDGTPFSGPGFLQAGEQIDWFATLRLRSGFTPLYRLWIYGTGGLAYGSVDYSATTDYRPARDNYYPISYSKTKLGWTAGIGAEWVTDWNWSVKIEDIYYDLGDESAVVSPSPSPDPPYQVGYLWHTQINVVRIGVNYKFF
ncbi:MAG TPA: outer membrane beta-barrel protein [bacterium]|nr:outer membrane beta-barrel protein [bacterium]